MDKRYQVFISSTYSDLQEERKKIIQVLLEMDCIPAGMELFPAADEDQLEFIKRIIDDCDYYLLVIGGRYGSLTKEGISYTEKEYDYAISKNIPVIALVHSNPNMIPIGKSETDPDLLKKLNEFRNKVKSGRIVKEWNSIYDLPGIVSISLQKTIKSYPAVGWVRADLVPNTNVYRQMVDLQNKMIEEIETKSEPTLSNIAINTLSQLERHELQIGKERINLVKILYAFGDALNAGIMAPSSNLAFDEYVKNVIPILDPVINSELIKGLEDVERYEIPKVVNFRTANLISPFIVYDIVEKTTNNSSDYGLHTELSLTPLGNEILKHIYTKMI